MCVSGWEVSGSRNDVPCPSSMGEHRESPWRKLEISAVEQYPAAEGYILWMGIRSEEKGEGLFEVLKLLLALKMGSRCFKA